MHYDYLIIGSGFGGAVSALRLAEKGWSVAIAEQGRRIGRREIEHAREHMLDLYWQPVLRSRGHFVQHVFRHVAIVGGVGVGGGSLVWGAVMLPPKEAFYESPEVRALAGDFRAELAPHLESASQAFGVNRNPRHTQMDEYLAQTADAMGAGDTFGPVPNAIHFGEPGRTVPDPYFDGAGPERTGCTFCASCMSGCPYGSKNSLDYNYLYLAERRGVRVIPQVRAQRIEPLANGGYAVSLHDPVSGTALWRVTADRVVIATGVVGTLDLLFRNRDEFGTLPRVSQQLGATVRTNSEAVVAVLHPPGSDLSDGTGISSDFYPNDHTHITQNRFHRNMRLLRFTYGPLVDGAEPLSRALRTLLAMITQLPLVLSNWFGRDWEKRVTTLTVMQDLDDKVRFVFRRRWWWPFRRRLVTEVHADGSLRSFIPEANEAARKLAQVSGGKPLNNLYETLGRKTVTAHILGGCPMGPDATRAVIDAQHEVHGHPGLFVVDGSSIPANIGVNPSLTIAAMAERFAALQPEKN